MDDNQQHSHVTMTGPSVAPQLEIIRGNEKGQIVRLQLKTRVGREDDNELVLTDPRVSRYHALIHLSEGQWVVQDVGSVNGTSVNGVRIQGRRSLRRDDIIMVGDTEMVFQPSKPGGAQAAPPSALAQRSSTTKSQGPRWSWLWIVGVLLLLLVIVVAVIFLRSTGDLGGEGDVTPTPTAVVDIPDNFILAYEDDFSNHNSGWDDAFDRYTTKQYGNNRYYVEVTTSNLVAWGLANRDVSNFRVSVEATQESGPNNNGYGLLFRFLDRDNYYRFDISGEGFFLLSKFYEGEWVTLIPWTASSAINVGQATNEMAVEAIDDQIRIYANGEKLGEIQDDSLVHGNFGFFANTFSEPNLIISFDNIKLWVPKGEAIAVIPTATPTRYVPSPTLQATLVPAPGTEPAEEVAQVEPETDVIQTPTAAEEPTEEAVVEAEDTPTEELAEEAAEEEPEATPTAVALPEYTSRDVPQARNQEELSGRVYFPVFDPEAGTYNIISTEPDGADRQVMVEEASQPTINSDGQRIAYRSWKADNRGLIEQAIDGSGDEWRFNRFFESAQPKFAPDGQSFLFHSRESGDIPAIYQTQGAEAEVLRREGGPIQGQSPAWVDTERFVYQGCLGTGDCGLVMSNLDGAFPKQITRDPNDTNPGVSVDEMVAFMSQRQGNWDVYIVDTDGNGLTQLTTDPGNDGLPLWMPDGKTILFVSDRDGEWAMWAMDADGDNQRSLFELGGSIDGQVELDVQNARGWTEESISWGP